MNVLQLPAQVPWLSLIWLCLLVPSVIIMLLPAGQKQAIRVVGTSFAFLSLVLAALVFLGYDYHSASRFQFVETLPWLPQLGINYTLAVDGISTPMLLLNGLVIFTAALVSWNIEERCREYWVLLLMLAVGVYGVFVSIDLFLLFVFYELAVLPMYLLVGIWGSVRKEYGALKLTLYLMGGSALIIFGMVAVYFGSGLRTFDLRLLAQGGLFSRSTQVAIFPALFVGFAVLAGMFPFHSWSPVGYAAAPTAASMMHAGVLKNLGAYGCIRVAVWLMPYGASYWMLPLSILVVVGVLYAAVIGAVQPDMKYMLGYSSVSHMALTLLGIASGTTIGMTGAVLQMFAHGAMTALFFAVVGRMIYERTHTRQLPELGGLLAVMPFTAVLFIIAGLSAMGMPGLAGFWAELNILMGMWQAYPIIAVLAALAIPVTVTYILRAIHAVFFAPLRNQAFLSLPKLTWQERTAGILLAVVVIGCGIFPGILTEPIASGVAPVAAAVQQAAQVALGR